MRKYERTVSVGERLNVRASVDDAGCAGRSEDRHAWFAFRFALDGR